MKNVEIRNLKRKITLMNLCDDTSSEKSLGCGSENFIENDSSLFQGSIVSIQKINNEVG